MIPDSAVAWVLVADSVCMPCSAAQLQFRTRERGLHQARIVCSRHPGSKKSMNSAGSKDSSAASLSVEGADQRSPGVPDPAQADVKPLEVSLPGAASLVDCEDQRLG